MLCKFTFTIGDYEDEKYHMQYPINYAVGGQKGVFPTKLRLQHGDATCVRWSGDATCVRWSWCGSFA